MAQLLPNADLYALTLNPATTFRLGGRQVKTTFIDKLRPIRGRHDLQLPLMPLAWRYASRRHYEMVVTSSHACVKGFWPARKALHLCYCYTPMRYVWLSSVDARGKPSPSRAMAEAGLRSWDLRSVKWVDEFAAISTEVQTRIETIYSRFSRVIHPPVATDFFTPGDGAREDFVLAVGRMVPYKRLDLAIRACNAADCRLVIAGFGPEEQSLRALADRLEAHVDFVAAPEDEQLRAFYRAARAVLFPAHEDFGLVPVEAQACGTPVLALGRGGSVDTVVDGVTGILVKDHTEDQWISGLHTLLESQFDPSACRRNALRFSRERFSNEFSAWLSDAARSRGVKPPYLDSPVIR